MMALRRRKTFAPHIPSDYKKLIYYLKNYITRVCSTSEKGLSDTMIRIIPHGVEDFVALKPLVDSVHLTWQDRAIRVT